MTFLLPDEILAKYLLHKYFIDNVTCGWKRADDRVELRMKIAPPDGCPQLWSSGYYITITLVWGLTAAARARRGVKCHFLNIFRGGTAV